MSTLLVLGSKPDPVLPERSQYDDVACANASGASAFRNGLPTPAFTVMSSILTSGKNESNRLALKALKGLRTGTLYVYPRAPYKGNPVKQAMHFFKTFKTNPAYFRSRIKSLGYHFNDFVSKPLDYYIDTVKALCDHDDQLQQCIAKKLPSTGMVAIAVGIGEHGYDRVIVSGFSFEITHAYASNPLIKDRGTVLSKHADTDIAFLERLSKRNGSIYTTEPIVNERTGVPLLNGLPAKIDDRLPPGGPGV